MNALNGQFGGPDQATGLNRSDVHYRHGNAGASIILLEKLPRYACRAIVGYQLVNCFIDVLSRHLS